MQIPKTYDPKQYEPGIYAMWEQSGVFSPQKGKGKPFSIIMPPPNANGSLHAGHLMYVVEDILTRYARMQGRPALWLPGTDHAGIETQFVYEKQLATEGRDRFDLGPDEFYRQVMQFTKDAQHTIINQFRSMGFSADWSRLKFTLDEDIIDTVYDTFLQLYNDGHIYRGNRLVNWCTRCQAAFADIELDRQAQTDTIYTLDYGPLKIATVRPETIFADVAVAVNPQDERYQDLIGQQATIPLTGHTIPVIADSHVDPGFGTGALKITPGHDQTDYEIGQAHQLPEVSVIDPEGKLINVPEQFAGLNVEEGRQRVVDALKQARKLVDTKNYEHNVAIHDRCGNVIEPLISEQWFLRIKQLNQPVIQAIENEDIKFHPKRFKKNAIDWLKNERDWCISRQIWWGIRIPVYYKTSHDPDKEPYLIAKTEAEAISYYGEGNYRAETDTFDTWFSSGQWPYATLMSTGDFKEFYPTTVMGTARDILHKWVTRMIMFSLYKTKTIPFEHIYLWGMVTDEHGQKLSKSKGNYTDPMEITAQYGTDALRLALAASNTPGSNSPLGVKQVEAMRNFCNKLWNVSRFILDKVDENYQPSDPRPASLADRWFASRLNQQVDVITQLVESYRFNEATQQVYHLLWSDFADWYIEASKTNPNTDLLITSLETILKLAHPFAPFVTEAIWQQLPWQKAALITSEWPSDAVDKGRVDESVLLQFNQLQNLVIEIRRLVADLDLRKTDLYHFQQPLLEQNAELIQQLAPISTCASVSDGYGLPVPNTTIPCWIDVDDHTLKRYRNNLEDSLKQTDRYIQSLHTKLKNKDFLRHAPKDVVSDTKERHKEAITRYQTLSEQLKRLDSQSRA